MIDTSKMLLEVKQAADDGRFPQDSYAFLVTMVENYKKRNAMDRAVESLFEQDACYVGMDWMKAKRAEGRSLQEVWNSCPHPAWLAWMLWKYLRDLDTPEYCRRVKDMEKDLRADPDIEAVDVTFAGMVDMTDMVASDADGGAMLQILRHHFPWEYVAPLFEERFSLEYAFSDETDETDETDELRQLPRVPRRKESPTTYKPTICIDFDGVLHSYTSGWDGADVINDPPVPGALEWLVDAVFDGTPSWPDAESMSRLRPPRAQIAIYSSRSKEPGGIEAMKEWLVHWTTARKLLAYPSALIRFLDFPTEKPAAIMTIDDRAHRFEGKFRSLEWYLNFRPWNKRTPERNIPDYAQPGYAKDWNDDDEQLADQSLECLLDCLVTDKDGFNTFEPSALEYMASAFMEARKNADIPTTKLAADPPIPSYRLPAVEQVYEILLDNDTLCMDRRSDRLILSDNIVEALRMLKR